MAKRIDVTKIDWGSAAGTSVPGEGGAAGMVYRTFGSDWGQVIDGIYWGIYSYRKILGGVKKTYYSFVNRTAAADFRVRAQERYLAIGYADPYRMVSKQTLDVWRVIIPVLASFDGPVWDESVSALDNIDRTQRRFGTAPYSVVDALS